MTPTPTSGAKPCCYCGIHHTVAPSSGGRQYYYGSVYHAVAPSSCERDYCCDTNNHSVVPPSGGRQYYCATDNAMMPSYGSKQNRYGNTDRAVISSFDGKPYNCNNTTYDYPHSESCKNATSVAAELKCFDESQYKTIEHDKTIDQVCMSVLGKCLCKERWAKKVFNCWEIVNINTDAKLGYPVVPCMTMNCNVLVSTTTSFRHVPGVGITAKCFLGRAIA